ncbi:M28 family peptidase [Aminicella lysinilytica]|uniref:PA domain-containing protein n=1 Tax=Aminicella lysinilytica TaxID=433323 RepID=A0A4R6PXA0_9FIRM|nr:M28 family peptidase [Aminicella lysinilytica]TDP45908.1 PA domain-containing protein [Aminicella lysinilytica]
MNIYEKFKNEISIDNIYKDMSFLVDNVGERLSGTGEMEKATKYICDRLIENTGVGRIDHFPMYMSYPGEASLELIAPCKERIAARPVCHIDSTPESGLEGEVVYLGSGGYEDYAGIDAKDKIILTDMSWSPARPEKARIACEMGAKALIIMNWGASDSDLIQMGAVKTQWGNPTPYNEKEIIHLTVISISRKDGEWLEKMCSETKVVVNIKAAATREWITASQPVGRVKSNADNDEYVLVGSHVDAWGKSAICNASGDALNLELARVCNKYKAELQRDVEFVFWDGHEIAEGGGSTWYADNYWADMSNNCVAYINIDNLAIEGTTVPGVEGQPELKEMLTAAIEKIFGTKGVWHQAYKGGGDSSFFGVGVPYNSFATEYTDEKLIELNHAFYSPWLHTPDDTIDKIDKALMKKHAQYVTYILDQLANSKIIPYNLKDLGDDIKKQWMWVTDKAGRAKNLLSALDEIVEEYRTKMSELENMKSKDIDPALLNKLSLLCERETAMFRCWSGKYGQDGCGSLQTEKAIPALDYALEKYNDAEVYSHEYYLWETQVLRIRNMVFDELNTSINFINLMVG